MTYFKVDDQFHSHPKTMSVSLQAKGLWVVAGSWCGAHATDGHIPARALVLFGANESTANELIDAGLWERTESGYVFHDWLHHQFSKAEIDAHREYEREKKRKQRAKKREQLGGDSLGDNDGMSLGDNLGDSPVPSRGSPGMVGMVGLVNTSKEKREEKTDQHFAEFWSVYPRKVGKTAAQKAFIKALTIADASVIIEGATRYANDPNRSPEFTAHPTTWINQGRWDDDPLPARRDDSKQAQRRANFEAFIGQGQISAG